MTNKRKQIFLVCSGILILHFCFGQNQPIDSLMNAYQAYPKNDTSKYFKLVKIYKYYQQNDAAKALAFTDSLLSLAKKTGSPVALNDAYFKKADLMMIQGFEEMSTKIYLERIKTIDNDTSWQMMHDKSRMHSSLADNYRRTNQFDNSLKYHQSSLELAYKIKDTIQISSNYNGIGTLYMAIADWTTALAYFRKNKVFLEANNSSLLNKPSFLRISYVSAFINIGNILIVLKQYDESLNTLQQGLELCKVWKLPNPESAINNLLAVDYFEKGDYYKSYQHINSAYQFHFKKNDKSSLCMDYRNIARLFRDAPDSFLNSLNINASKKYDTALALLNKSIKIADDLSSLTLAEDPVEDISILYEKMNNYPKAYEAYKRFKLIHDSLGSSSQQKAILVNDMQYQFGRQTDSLKYAQSLQQSKLMQLISLNEQKSLLANKEKELQHLAFLKTQADLQNTSLQNIQNEKELTITKNEKDLQTIQVSKLAKDKELSAYKLNQQKIISAIVIGALSALTFFIVYNSRLRRKRITADFEKDKANQQLKEAELKNKMNDISMMALRSQMNPHFIFNCLNSIMLYTVENKTDEAAEYINRFAKLIRNMLDSSRSDRVTLHSELESIRLYIELEAMRFKNKLQYTIDVDKNIDEDFTELPPLLIQPYIENAIWHGLMPKTSGGNISIHVAEATDNLLVIKITDDGIGRVAAAAIKSKKETYHKSLGTKVTGERIALINEKFKSNATVVINDLYNNNEAAGTQVIIKLPLE